MASETDIEKRRGKRQEEAIFSSNQIVEAIRWIKHRENYKIKFQLTGAWKDADIDGTYFAEGKILKRWDGKAFNNDIYLFVENATIGELKQLETPKFHHLLRMMPDDIRLDIETLKLTNSFIKDAQETLFFRKNEYLDAYNYIKPLLDKFDISVVVEGTIENKQQQSFPTILTGLVKHAQNDELYIEVDKTISIDKSVAVDKLKAVTKRRWLFRAAEKGQNRIHPRYVYCDISKTLEVDKALEVKDLFVAYGDNVVLKGNVNFTIRPGEIMGIIGESGSGKSTTMKAILGEIPYEGEINVFGMDAKRTKTISPHIGYIPQDLSRMYQQFTPLENIIAFASQYNIPERVVLERGKRILEDLGIATSQSVRDLSGGQKRRVSIAISMAHNPRMLFLDEPTSGLDPTTRFELWKYMDIINKRYGTTLVVISHYLDEIEFCDTAALFLNEFGFYDYGSPSELKSKLPGGGLAMEVTLEKVTLQAKEILSEIENVEFVIQRGERFRILSDVKTDVLAERVLAALSDAEIHVHEIEYKVNIDMVDYFTYVSTLRDEKFGEQHE